MYVCIYIYVYLGIHISYQNMHRLDYYTILYICILVDRFNPSEKYESVGVIIPNIWIIKDVPNHQPNHI